MCPSKYEKIIAIDVPFENAQERASLTCGSRMVGEVTPQIWVKTPGMLAIVKGYRGSSGPTFPKEIICELERFSVECGAEEIVG